MLVDHLFGSFDRVFRQFVLAVQFSVELRCYSDVESKREGVLVVEVDLRCFLIRQRITQDLQFVVLDVLLQVLTYQFVQHVGEDTLTVHLLYQACRNHSRTETGHLCFLTHLLQFFGYFFLIICRLNRERYYSLQVFQFTLFNFHNMIVFIFIAYLARNVL